MGRKISEYRKVLKVLEELHSKYPQFDIMRHITTATDEYGDTWGMTDKELLFALEKYKMVLDLDQNNIVDEEYLSRIIEDAQNLTSFDEEDDY